MFHIGQEVIVSARKATVISTETKRGRVLCRVRFEDGREAVYDSRNIEELTEFAPPVDFGVAIAEVKRDEKLGRTINGRSHY